jgi:hypothetical protein
MDESSVTQQLQLLDDPFTAFVMARIPDEVRKSLDAEQYEAIRKAIFQSRPGQGHAVDLRFTVPLGFMRGYVVLQIGRDKRRGSRRDMRGNRSLLSRAFDRFAALILMYCVAASVLVSLYAVKSLLGINLFADRHLLDFIAR